MISPSEMKRMLTAESSRPQDFKYPWLCLVVWSATGPTRRPSVTLRVLMTVKVLFVGQLKDVTGRSEDRLDLADGADLDGVFRHYAERFPKIREMARSIVMARNHEFATLSAPVADGDEIAFLPPVSGGATSAHDGVPQEKW